MHNTIHFSFFFVGGKIIVMKYIIAIVVVVVGNAIVLSISYNLGALLTAILSGGLVVWGFNYVGLFGKKKM